MTGRNVKGNVMDLDDAYANAAYIPDADGFIAMWEKAAATFRASGLCEIDLQYGESERQRIDLFHPPRLAKGLVVFVHGGYWLRFDKSYWSHLAAGPLANGWAVAMPSYDLCPDVRITDIGNQVAQAIGFAAARVPGPIRLVGHSAGGQLVARMSQERSGALWQERVEKIVSISPVADLAPLMRTSMNKELRLTEEEVARESPVHLAPPSIPVTVWVGADERPVFLEQSRALSNAWKCREVIVPDRHHFDIIAGMSDPQSPLTREILG